MDTWCNRTICSISHINKELGAIYRIMSPLQYFKTAERLPDPRGPLSRSLTSSTIASSSRKVLEATATKSSKRGSYTKQVYWVTTHEQM